MSDVQVLDTTLRDGDQAAGFAFPVETKIELGWGLFNAGVDTIETGFPLSNRTDFTVCRLLAEELPGATAVMCLGRQEDIRRTAEVFSGISSGTLHISLPVSDIHMESKLGKTRKQLLALVKDVVGYASGLVNRIELGAEDASRADRAFLAEYCATAVEAGAAVINIADTLGLFCPTEIHGLIRFLLDSIPAFRSRNTLLSVHCHNDLGLASANTLAAIEAGCSQIEVSLSGIGERAGNAAIEEIVSTLLLKENFYKVSTSIDIGKLGIPISLASEATGASGSPMKPLTGWNVHAHGSGLHQQGLYRNGNTYLPVGFPLLVPERIVLSRHSGRRGVALFSLRYLNLNLEEQMLSSIINRIKESPLSVQGTIGITEFLLLLIDMDLLPHDSPTPLESLSFQELYSEKIVEFRATITGSLYKGEVSGKGKTSVDAVMDALRFLSWCLIGDDMRLERLDLSGSGSRYRVYAQLKLDDRDFALERAGNAPLLLLFRCGLDMLNAMTWCM